MLARLMALTLLILACPSATAAADDKAKNGSPEQVFGLDKAWSIQLTIQPKDWQTMQPTRRGMPFGPGGFGPGGFGPGRPKEKEKEKAKPDEKDADRRPHGLFGMDFAYVKCTVEIDGKVYKDVGIRFKGSGTYISAQGRLKLPFKIDFDRYVEGQAFKGLRKIALNNNAMEPTAFREVLAYPVFRALGVAAPRTAYAAVTLSIPGKYDKEFLGLYVLAEPIDKTFLKDRFGSSKGLLLKPERVGAVEYLGEDWSAYEQRYQPKTDAGKKAQRRLIEFTRLVQKADDATFAKQVGDHLDIDQFLRFLAGNVALSSMDSFIGMGRNFYLYLNPKTNKFVFIPWDVDLAFGAFLVMGSPDGLMDLSIRQPQTGRNRLIERLLADKKVYATYARHLEAAVTKALTAEGIKKDLAAIKAITDPIKEKERRAATARREAGGPPFGAMFSRAPTVDTFVEKRIASIKGQLAGERKGTVLRSGFGFGPPGGGGFGPPPGGFGPGQFLTRPILNGADKDKDGKLSKEELTAGAKALFKALDTGGKGEVDQKAMTAGLDKLLPIPGFPGGRPPAGFPTLGDRLARASIERAGKDGKVTEASLAAAADKLFAEADRNKDGKLEERELAEGLNRLMPPPQFGPGGPGRPPGGAPPARKPPEKEREGEKR